MNFEINTYPTDRKYVFNLFKDRPFCLKEKPKNHRDYLIDLANSKFVLSPRGAGIDCHRTWEALLMGAIPIVKTSSIDPLFEGLPVLIIQDWNEITEDFLHQKWEEMQATAYQLERMYVQYWLDQISSYK